MARNTLSPKHARKLDQLKDLQAEIANMEQKAALRIAQLAIKAGLVELNLPAATLMEEFAAIAARFRAQSEV